VIADIPPQRANIAHIENQRFRTQRRAGSHHRFFVFWLTANCQRPIAYLHTSIAWPVSDASLAEVALTVTGLATAAVQVAVTCPLGLAERWTEGSLTVQLELISAAVAMPTHPEPLKRSVALKVWLLAGGVAVWSTVADCGVMFRPMTVQLLLELPQPAIASNAAQNRTDAHILHGNMVRLVLPAA
jgi:hypothetical protein